MINLKDISLHKETLKSVIKIGLPTGLQSVMYSISNLIIQTGVNSLGTTSIAAWNVSAKIDGLFWMMINAFGISITTFVGQNYGAGKMDRVKKSIKTCFMMCSVTSVMMSIIFMTLGPAICTLFTARGK